MLLRADSLHRLTPDDHSVLAAIPVRTVIDLRHDGELAAAPNPFAQMPGVAYHHVPIIRTPPTPAAENADSPAVPRDLGTVYRYIVDECQAGLRAALTTIADAGEGTVLFHCTAGKDRTGIIAGLVLGMVGVSPEVIAADYGLTTEAMAAMRPALMAQMTGSGRPADEAERMLSSDPELLLNLLAYLREQHGSLDAYLRVIGLTDDHITRIRSRLLASGTNA